MINPNNVQPHAQCGSFSKGVQVKFSNLEGQPKQLEMPLGNLEGQPGQLGGPTWATWRANLSNLQD